jgi:hypothetical protein
MSNVTMTKIYNDITGEWVMSKGEADGVEYRFDGGERGGRLYRISLVTWETVLIAILRAGQCPQERANVYIATGN